MPRATRAKLAPAAVPVSPELVKARVAGSSLISPLKKDVDALVVKTAEDYQQADFLIARIAAARTTWRTKMDPILNPLQDAIDKAKLAMAGAKALDKEVDGPLAELETTVKNVMADYKLEEARLANERQRLADEAAAALRRQAAQKALQANAAATPQLKARLEQARADLEQHAAFVEQKAEQENAPVQTAASTARFQKKIRIADPLKFIGSMVDYEPKAGIYRMQTPPLTLLTKKIKNGLLVDEDSAVDVLTTELNKIYKAMPGIALSWPGVEEYDDVTIARR